MVQIGKIQNLKINNIVSIGAYLDAGTGNEKDNILLPNNQLPKDAKEGDVLEVFIYRDSEDRLIATRKKPLAQVGELAYLEVVENTNIGAFLDWGLEKDLFVPFSEQRYKLKPGKKYLVAVYLDKSKRICATTDIYKYLKTNSPYKKGDEVMGTVYLVNRDIGVFVAVDNMYKGLIPKNECYKRYENGEVVKTRVIRVRDDGKLDLSPRKLAYQQIEIDAEMLLEKIKNNKGYLPLNDKSKPEVIKKELNLSKSAFKRAVGRLLKEKKIKQTEEGLILIK